MGKFVLNKRTVAWAAKNDKGIAAQLTKIAEPIARDAGADRVDEYTTDRTVRGIVGFAEDQAKNGSATKAAAKNGRRLR